VLNKIKQMFTDPLKIKKNDPGHPDNCVVCAFHKIYSQDEADAVISECRAGTRGCMDCKKQLHTNLENSLAPIREKRAEIDAKPDFVKQVIEDGNARANLAAEETMKKVRRIMRVG